MKYLSTFSGIGVFELAVQQLGLDWECVGYSEINPQAEAVYKRHFPHHINLGDITKINISELPDFDFLVGGSPCQDLSIVNPNRQGLSGDKSSLFYKYLEILCTKKPKYFLLENVYSMPQEAQREITRLVKTFPIVIDAAKVSAQHRERLFWCNWNIEQPDDRGIMLKDILEKYVDIKYALSHLAPIVWEKNSSTRVGLINGENHTANRIYSDAGKAVTLTSQGGGYAAKSGLYLINKHVRRLTPVECERLQCLPDNYTEGFADTHRYCMIGNGFNLEVIKHILQEFLKNKRKNDMFEIYGE